MTEHDFVKGVAYSALAEGVAYIAFVVGVPYIVLLRCWLYGSGGEGCLYCPGG